MLGYIQVQNPVQRQNGWISLLPTIIKPLPLAPDYRGSAADLHIIGPIKRP
jgi:hypothetical protein